jgi:hypothetical protein
LFEGDMFPDWFVRICVKMSSFNYSWK